MLNFFEFRIFALAAFLCAGAGVVIAAEKPAAEAQKPADTKAVTRPAQIEPIVGPVKRSAPEVPENKAKAADNNKSSEKAKPATAGKELKKVSNEPVKKTAVKSRESKPAKAKSATRSNGGKKSKVTKKKTSNKLAAKKAH